MEGLAVEPGRLVVYKPLLENLPENERHLVKVVSVHRDVVVVKDVFGNEVELSWGRVEKVLEDEGGRWQSLADSLLTS